MFWAKKKQIIETVDNPIISEFENAKLEKTGTWVQIDILVSDEVHWTRWQIKYNGSSKKLLLKSLLRMVLDLQDKENHVDE